MVTTLTIFALGMLVQQQWTPDLDARCMAIQRALLRDPSVQKPGLTWSFRRSENLIIALAEQGAEMLFEASDGSLREAKLGATRSPEPKAEPKLAQAAQHAVQFLASIGLEGGDAKTALALRESAATEWFSIRQFIHGYPTAHVHQFQFSLLSGDLLSYAGPSRFVCTKPSRILTRNQAFEKLREVNAKEKPGATWRNDLVNGPMWSQINREMRYDELRPPVKSYVELALKERILAGEALLVYQVELINASNRREICYGFVEAETGQVIVANWTNRTIRP